MASHRLASMKLGDLDVIGYSMAGEESVVAMPQLDVCFDIGKAPDQVISINHVLLSHGHMDHAAGIAYYLSHRHFDGQAPGTVLMPVNLVPALQQILEGWAQLDGNRIPANLVPVGPGEEYWIKPNLLARAFPTDHCQGSVGYTILERRKKLRPEFTSLTGPQIVELKKQGTTIDMILDIPLVTYLGDTQYMDFSGLDYVVNSRILITECTFYEDEHLQRAQAGRHLHITDLEKMLGQFHSEHIIITHTSQRTGLNYIKKAIQRGLPESTVAKTLLLMDRTHMPNHKMKKANR